MIAELYRAPLPDSIKLAVFERLCAWRAYAVSTCLHAPDPADSSRPEIYAAAWSPLVVCESCIGLLGPRPGSVEDRTCDLCGHVAALDYGDDVRGVAAELGRFHFMYGVCNRCQPNVADIRYLRSVKI